jgi:hypothetical protein
VEGTWTPPHQPEAEQKSEGKDESGLPEQQRKGVKRARRLAQQGFLGKASDTLQTASSPLQGRLPPSAEVIAGLREITPPKGYLSQTFPKAPSQACRSRTQHFEERARKSPTVQRQTFSDGVEN